ncbi:MAG: adenosylcobinamide-GDP ribazoletransferase [Bacteroidales bacterium]|jgi:adenosylcobinamide-GDP ribazoletransferase|nr:adenosylcobinamide-GDP ribazoletransferase [Bacteroidales bacterium]
MNLLAAFIFFTRLPFWRIKNVPSDSFKYVVPYWPLVGWLTGGLMVLTLWLCAHILPVTVAWIVAIVVRLLLTGALHEDGLADFLDGFGGGTTRERVLSIMKDSHIGTYGVIGLIVYYLLLMQMTLLPLETLCLLVLCGDCWAKFVASQITNLLPYARKEEESKSKVVYSRMRIWEICVALVAGVLPAILLLPLRFWIALLFPVPVLLLLYLLMRRKIGGYTGDCCGALFLLCELSFYIGGLIIWKFY